MIDTYREHSSPHHLFSIFRPGSIDGLPVVEQETSDLPSSCTITVELAERQALETTTDVEDVDQNGTPAIEPCGAGRPVIEAIVSNLPPLR